jgi:exonuclease SbcC
MRTLEDFISEDEHPVHEFEKIGEETKITVGPTQGFIIKDIEMKGFMRYVQKTDPKITFEGKYTVITGKTGCGKTSILDAITFALYKKTSRTDIQSIKISDVCQPGGYVRVSFYQGGDEYNVERGFTSSSSPYLTVKKNGGNIEGNIKELEKTILDIIGLDYDSFRNSTFVRQDEMKELGAESGAKRLEIFQKLFRLETFEKAQQLVAQKSDFIKKNIRSLQTEIRVRSEQVGKLPKLKEEVSDKKELVGKENENLKEMEEALENINKDLESLQIKHDEFSRKKGRMASSEDRLKKIEKKLDKAQEDMKKVKPLKKEITFLESQTREYEDLRAQGDVLLERQRAHHTLKKDLDRESKLKASILKEQELEENRLKKRISEFEHRIKKLSTDIGKEEAFSMLRSQGSLSERMNRIGMELEWLSENKELVGKLEEERKDAKKELEDLDKRTDEINEDSFVLSEIESNMDQVKKDIDEVRQNYKKKIEDVENKINEWEKELKEIGFSHEDKKKISEIRGKVTDLQKKKAELDSKRKKLEKIGDLGHLISDLNSQKTQIEDELRELKGTLRKLASEEERYQKAHKDQKRMQRDKEALFGKVSRWEGEIAKMESQIVDLKSVKKQLKEKEEELKGLQDSAEIYSILREKVFHRRGIVMYAIDQLLPQLSLETSTNLSDMTDGRFSKVRLASYGENNRYGIRIEVAGSDGNWHDVQEFSGGEKTQINAALRFAIAKELASMPQVGRTYGRMKTLFIDEGDLGSLDTESSRQLFVSKLFDMGEFFEKIILITHLSEVAERFPHRIMVYMTPEEESRIKVMA